MTRPLLAVLLLLAGFSAPAQRSLVFNRLSTIDGLNTNKVKCVWQDKTGFLWIGTENGIQRYDGRKFINFGVRDESKWLPPAGVDEIMDAGDGKMWVRLGLEVGRFDLTSFTYEKALVRPSGEVPKKTEYRLARDSKGNTFLCIINYGLLHYDSVTNAFIEINSPVKVPEHWPVRSLYEDAKTGDYYISSDSGLAIYKSATKELFYREHNPQKISLLDKEDLYNLGEFMIDHNNTWWLLYWKFFPVEQGPVVLHYDPVTQKILPDTAGIISSIRSYTELHYIEETRNGQIWIGGLNALFTYDAEQKRFHQNRKNNPAEFDIRCRNIFNLFESRENNLWISTDNGLYVTSLGKTNVFNLVLIDEPGKEFYVNTILETKNKENWVGTWGQGVLFFDNQFKKINVDLQRTRGRLYNSGYAAVWDMCQHSATSTVWTACQGGYIAVYNPQSKKIIHWLAPPVFEGATVRQVKEDYQGNLWFSSQRGQLVKWNKHKTISNTNFELVKKLTINTPIQRIFFDTKNRIWLTTSDLGVYVLDETGKKELYHFTHNERNGKSLTSNWANDIVQYNDSLFFINTGAISLVNSITGDIKKITLYDGLPATTVSQITKDSEGILWMITNNGLSSYNYEKNIFTSYNNRDGIMYAEAATSGKCNMQNGEIWFGGGNVIFGFNPDGLKMKSIPPDVILTDFKLINDFIPMDSLQALPEIRLKSNEHSFAIYFSSLSFSQQDKLTYYYRMEGIDNEWVRSERNLVASYTILPPGHYTFKVLCENMQGIASNNITTLKIYIAAPFYKTWWFIAILALVVASLIYFFYKLRLNRLLAVEKLRNKVARDLHDDMGSTLSTINILSSMAKTKLNNNLQQTSEYISKISDNSQRMMEAMDDIVWSIKPDNDTMQRITGRMREFATSIMEAKNIDIDFRVEDNVKDVKLNMEARRDFFLVFKEAVNNAAKYSKCKRVGIQVAYHHKRLVLAVKDDGIGFDVEKADEGNGLGNMHKRAEALKARLQVYSKPGQGTQVILNLPVT